MQNKNRGKNRIARINDELLHEIANIIRSDIKDPRVSKITTVTSVEVTNDLKYSKVYVSILGNEKEKEEVLVGLKNATGFIRKQVAQKVNLRNTPEIKFLLDTSLEYSIKISKLIEDANKSSGDTKNEE